MLKSLSSLLCICLLFSSCTPSPDSTEEQNMDKETVQAPAFDWQGHRGARGLAPENTIPAFLLALEIPQVKTLELDVVITKDEQVIVSHEPWMSAVICSHPDGKPVLEDEQEQLKIFEMTLDEVQAYDCGSRGHQLYPRQKAQPANKPTLEAAIIAAEKHARTIDRPLPYYNIEIKSLPVWDNIYTPPPARFTELVLQVIKDNGVYERTNLQSFDFRTLRAIREQAPDMPIAQLVGNTMSLQANLDSLGIKPDIYSPYYLLLSRSLLDSLRTMDIKLIPWTVNDTSSMRQLYEAGVDGIITDYPNLAF